MGVRGLNGTQILLKTLCLLVTIDRKVNAVYWLTNQCCHCRAIQMKGMVFRYMWVYSKEDTMAHTYRPVVTSELMARSAYETLFKGLMDINESSCWP